MPRRARKLPTLDIAPAGLMTLSSRGRSCALHNIAQGAGIPTSVGRIATPPRDSRGGDHARYWNVAKD